MFFFPSLKAEGSRVSTLGLKVLLTITLGHCQARSRFRVGSCSFCSVLLRCELPQKHSGLKYPGIVP